MKRAGRRRSRINYEESVFCLLSSTSPFISYPRCGFVTGRPADGSGNGMDVTLPRVEWTLSRRRRRAGCSAGWLAGLRSTMPYEILILNGCPPAVTFSIDADRRASAGRAEPSRAKSSTRLQLYSRAEFTVHFVGGSSERAGRGRAGPGPGLAN